MTIALATSASAKLAGLPDGISGQALSEQLERVLASATFVNSERLTRFLRIAVESAAEGHTTDLKEYALGLSVFDKGDSFDPRFDSIVRVEAGRLRTRLKQYYDTEGLRDALVIELPKGSYVPKFVLRQSERGDCPAPAGL